MASHTELLHKTSAGRLFYSPLLSVRSNLQCTASIVGTALANQLTGEVHNSWVPPGARNPHCIKK